MGVKSYSVVLLKNAEKKLSKLDAPIRDRIQAWIDKNLEGCENPRLYGKALEGKLSGLWRYRVGDYRIVADIKDDKVIIFVINVDKRNDIYR